MMAMTRSDWVLRLSSSPEFLEADPEAAIALDGAGRIIGLTHAAQAALSPGTALLGQRLDQVTDLSAVWVIADVPEPLETIPNRESSELRWVAEDEVAELPLHPGFAASWQQLRVVTASLPLEVNPPR